MKFYRQKRSSQEDPSEDMQYPEILDELMYGYALQEVIFDKNQEPIDYKFLKVNPAFSEIIEVSDSNLLNKNASEILPYSYQLILQKYKQASCCGKTIKFEQYDKHLNKYFEITVIKNSPNKFSCIYNDMTHCERIKNNLKNSETRLDSILSNIHNITSIIDLDGIIKYISTNCEKLSGWSQEDCIGKKAWFPVHPDHLDKIKDVFQQLLQTENKPITVQCKAKTKDGTYKWMEICAINKSCDSKIKGILLNYHYIDERKKREETLESRIVKLSQPLNNANDVNFEELFDMEDIQRLQDEFAEANGVASVITHIDGTPITKPSRFCRLCSDIIRNTEKGRANCYRSDAYIGSSCEDGPTIETCLSGGLWDAGAGISVGGRHIANWLIGQVRDETQSEEKMRDYARKIGADEDMVAEAFKEVTPMSKEKFENVSKFLFTLASQLSKSAYQNVQQARFIFERKKAEDALRASEARYARVIRGTNDGFWEWNIKSDEDYLSPRWMEILGFDSKDKLEPHSALISRVHPEDVSRVNDAIKAHLEKDLPYNLQIRIRTKDNSYRWVVTRGMAERNKKGEPILMSGAITDISERKKAEDDLATEKENLAVTLRSIGDGVITTDTEGKIVMLNKVAEQMTEWCTQDAAGHPLFDVFNIVNENTGKKANNPVEKVLSTGNIIELENHTALISKNGNKIIISDSAAPIRNIHSVIIGVVLVFRDMTEKNKLKESIQKTQKLESLGVLAGGIAHDFNNLFGGIFGYIELAMREAEQPKVLTYLSESLNSMERAKALTQQLLTFSKGGEPIKKTESLSPFIQERIKFALSGTSVSADFDTEDDLWLCKFDKNQITQVVDHLTINAQQAMPNGGTIEVSMQNISISECENNELAPGDYVKIVFKDNGIGIPKELIPLIFDPYYTTKSKGHGLGLASCYSIINKHEGCINVESTLGEGSIFTIYLPTADETEKLKTDKKDSQFKGKGIFLVMDDEDTNLEIMKVRLESLGYKVVLTKNGKDAVEYFKEAKQQGKNIAGMIFDLTVPGGMGGKEAIKKIREISKDTPAFVASGYSSDPIMADPQKYGFTASICKPFMSDELSKMLEIHLIK